MDALFDPRLPVLLVDLDAILYFVGDVPSAIGILLPWLFAIGNSFPPSKKPFEIFIQMAFDSVQVDVRLAWSI